MTSPPSSSNTTPQTTLSNARLSGNSFPRVRLKDSIITRLLKVTFAIYFLVTLTVTITHMTVEYYHVKDRTMQDLHTVARTFTPSIREAVWRVDLELLQSTLSGMKENPVIIGVKIESPEKQVLGQIGDIDTKMEASQQSSAFNKLFSYQFPITNQNSDGSETYLGEVVLYTSTSLVWDKVQLGFMFIIVNSIIKTLALWIFFLWAGRALLIRPLSILTHATSRLDLQSLEGFRVDIQSKGGRHELKILEEAFNSMAEKLLASRQAFEQLTQKLEDKVVERTQKLEQALVELEQQNTALLASNRRLEDLHQTRTRLLQKLGSVHENQVEVLQSCLRQLPQASPSKAKTLMQKISQGMVQIEELFDSVKSIYVSEQAIHSKKVLLAETNKKQQIVAKMALGGTGVELDIVDNFEDGKQKLQTESYDIICANTELIDLAVMAQETNPRVKPVFMTSAEASVYLPVLKMHPTISNIIARNEDDRTFTLKNIITTVSKLINQDLFGMEKYLSWGVDIQCQTVSCSDERLDIINEMEEYFRQLGVRRTILRQSSMVMEELLMNAVYDAPTDAQGRPLYNHLPRTQPVVLKTEEQGTLRYACDGLLLAVSVEDPFGALRQETLLKHLEHGFYAPTEFDRPNQGGAGLGLFNIIDVSDLVVINVVPTVKTEVIAIFNIDPNHVAKTKNTSLHYFIGSSAISS